MVGQTSHLIKIGKSSPDQGLLNQALAFFEAGTRCVAPIHLTPTLHRSPMAPAIVCFAFSIEMYLKLLHFISTKKLIKGHDLTKLFLGLPEDIRQKLQKKYLPNDLINHIDSVSKAFVTWRYDHEYESLSINIQTLIGIARCCHGIVREVSPNLKVFGEN